MRLFNHARRRSDNVRRKINSESQEIINRASKRVRDVPVLDPHLSNFGSEKDITPFGNIKKKTRVRLGWRPLSLIISIYLIFLLNNAWQSPMFRISGIDIIGTKRIEKSDVQSVLNIEGQHSFAIDIEQIRNEIFSGFPEFRQVNITLEMPSDLRIRVEERQPVISWLNSDRPFWIDSEGYLIPARGESNVMLSIRADSPPSYNLQYDLSKTLTKKMIQDKASFLPGISDLAFYSVPKRIDDGLLSAILQLNAWMPEEKTLLYQRIRGLGWKDDRGWDVFVGQKLEKINEKMVMYQTIVNNLEDQEINPVLVSVEFIHAPYYRLEE